MSILEDNLAKIKELQPHVQYAGVAWCTDCENLNLRFRILEAFRTQERQEQLFAQGRTKPGLIVTQTLHSLHTERLAVDVVPLNCTYGEIAEVALRHNITHPFDWDMPHLQFDHVPEQTMEIKPEVRLKGFQTRLKNEKDPGIIAILKTQIRRLTERLNRL